MLCLQSYSSHCSFPTSCEGGALVLTFSPDFALCNHSNKSNMIEKKKKLKTAKIIVNKPRLQNPNRSFCEKGIRVCAPHSGCLIVSLFCRAFGLFVVSFPEKNLLRPLCLRTIFCVASQQSPSIDNISFCFKVHK